MNSSDKNLVFMIGIAAVLTVGAITENTSIVMHPQEAATTVTEAGKIKAELERAGLKPRDAMFWKEL